MTTTGSSPYSVTVVGLTNGTTYQLEVRALNARGHGPASAPQSVTPARTPGAPSITRVDAGFGAADITFVPPADDGGSAITGYELSLDAGATWTSVSYTYIGNGRYSTTVTGLTDGQNYPTEVRAVNGVGPGAGSPPADVPAVGTVPDAPTIDSVTAGDGQATVTFEAPASDGGAPVTSYQASVDGGTTWVTLTTTGSGPFAATLTGLTNGTTYPVTVRALNQAGPGSPSNSSSVTPVAGPVSTPPTVSGLACGFGSAGDVYLTFKYHAGSPDHRRHRLPVLLRQRGQLGEPDARLPAGGPGRRGLRGGAGRSAELRRAGAGHHDHRFR